MDTLHSMTLIRKVCSISNVGLSFENTSDIWSFTRCCHIGISHEIIAITNQYDNEGIAYNPQIHLQDSHIFILWKNT